MAYAPPFGAAKDIVNLAGFAACNRQDGLVKHTIHIPDDAQVQVIDVRGKPLAEAFPAPFSQVTNIPFPLLRSQLAQLDPSRPVITLCAFGKMSYFAARVLQQHGDVASFSGGLKANVDPRSPAKLPTP